MSESESPRRISPESVEVLGSTPHPEQPIHRPLPRGVLIQGGPAAFLILPLLIPLVLLTLVLAVPMVLFGVPQAFRRRLPWKV